MWVVSGNFFLERYSFFVEKDDMSSTAMSAWASGSFRGYSCSCEHQLILMECLLWPLHCDASVTWGLIPFSKRDCEERTTTLLTLQGETRRLRE